MARDHTVGTRSASRRGLRRRRLIRRRFWRRRTADLPRRRVIRTMLPCHGPNHVPPAGSPHHSAPRLRHRSHPSAERAGGVLRRPLCRERPHQRLDADIAAVERRQDPGLGHAHGRAGALGRARPGGAGAKHLPERRRPVPRACSATTAPAGRGRRRAAGSPSARGSSRRTAAAYGRRARGRAAARPSPSRRRRPGRPTPRRPATPPAPRPVSGRGEPSRILVVDDDPRFPAPRARRALEGRLRPARDRRATGPAPEYSATERPRLLLLDLMPPDTDCIELMRQVSRAGRPAGHPCPAPAATRPWRRRSSRARPTTSSSPRRPSWWRGSQAALRRREVPEPFALGEFAIHYEQRRMTVGGDGVELTTTEY